MRIGFWATGKDKFFVSHQKGINQEQLDVLHSLKLGDRLKLWKNDLDGNSPNFTVGELFNVKEVMTNAESVGEQVKEGSA